MAARKQPMFKYFWTIIAVLFLQLSCERAPADLPVLQVAGNGLVAGGHPIRLRGLNWGWWHLVGTRYTEYDMRRQAAWGANVARLAFSYGDLEQEDHPGHWREDGFHDLDDVLHWGAKYGVYIILDMHVVPGGQSEHSYTDGGRNLVWTDSTYRQRYLALWKEIARRYRNVPVVAAYELMNEPLPTSEPKDAAMRQLEQRAIATIRAVDPDKVIVVTGVGGGPLTEADKLDDPNIMYTFHFYDGTAGRWAGNLKNGDGLRGTMPWTRIDEPFVVPATVTALSVLLRSTSNSGTAWFDDVSLQEATGTELLHGGFDSGTNGFKPERGPKDAMAYDPAVGHDQPGSLRVSGTTSYNGWISGQFRVQAGKAYRLTCWIKLDNATGDTYLSAAFMATDLFPKDVLRQDLDKDVAFGTKHNVPLWVGEFGCESSVSPASEQSRWVKDCISLFEDDGLDWTYWNFKGTDRLGGMDVQTEHKEGADYPVNARLLSALRAGWALNGL